MNRKLHNTLLALSTTGLVLVAGLLVATPLTSAPTEAAAMRHAVGVETAPPTGSASGAPAERSARLAARSQRFESDLLQATDTCELLAHTASFVTEVAADAALSAAIAQIESAASAGSSAMQDDPKPDRTRRNSRSAFATPYFSFAHGLRDGTGA
ncbi:hypothetical protein [Luteimonas vadosa]|uniref:Uncharacterized protein n=1 Tax=Luteimonas vadosa TaxID=1165507 RepID=A0ABP9E3P6_9GAMM